MTSSSPAAEPSMEEILASIRRIISDGDDGAPREVPNSGGSASPAAAAPASPSAPSLAAPDVNRESASSEAAAAAHHHDVEDDDIFELTDAMLAEEAESDETPQAQSEPPQGSGPVAPTDPLPLVDPPQPEVEFDSAPSQRVQAGEPPCDANGHIGPEPEPAGAAPADSAASNPPAGEHLLSPATDAKVAAAFHQLAGTVLMKDARTLDDLVQEMLRPMLKEWLDDNLPQLVERLVREEIERVSRGRG